MINELSLSLKLNKNRIAVVNPNGVAIRYVDLEKQVKTVSLKFKSLGIEQCYLPILGPKSASVISTFLACIECNICYVPIDPATPLPRNETILRSINSAYLVIASDSIAIYASIIKELIAPLIEGLVLVQTTFGQIAHNQNSAYILFTSGSTGTPRGVVITRHNMFAFTDWSVKTFSHFSGRVLSIAPFNFDLSVFDIYFTLLTGGTLVIPANEIIQSPRELGRYLQEEKINILYTTPSAYRHFLKFGNLKREYLSKIKLVLCAGETLKKQLAEELIALFTNASVFNLYGPTETNVCTFYKLKDIEEAEDIPIGEVADHFSHILLNNGHINTEQGELCVAGKQVFEGYWNGNLPDKFTILHNVRYYNTGDWVYIRNDLLYFSNRIDRMIKHNGYRVEPGDIEEAILSTKQITWCHVLAHTLNGQSQLVAFMQAQAAEPAINVLQMKLHLAKNLPQYMLPSRYISVSEVPLTSNHKTDIQKLLSLLHA